MLKNEQTQYGKTSSASFSPLTWAHNPHIQTIYPKFFLRTPEIAFTRERIDTFDDDFLDLGILHPNQTLAPRAIAVLFHGLEGSENSHYIQHLAAVLQAMNVLVVVMHFRGCSGEINRQARAYHSGETQDALHTLLWIKKRYPQLDIFTVGFSLGGNMLLKLLSEQDDLLVKAAVSVSAPLHLAASSEAINRGFSKYYQAHLLKSMRANVLKKWLPLEMSRVIKITPQQVKTLASFRDFDEHITAPLHGFKGADDYYQRCSALRTIGDIRTPTLILHAADDPFMDSRVIPAQEALSAYTAYELSSHGGHVGFMGRQIGDSSNIRAAKLWLPLRISTFIKEHL